MTKAKYTRKRKGLHYKKNIRKTSYLKGSGYGNAPESFSNLNKADRFAKIEEMLNTGNVNKEDKYGNTPLYVSVFYGELDLVKRLLNAGANPNPKSSTFNPLIASLSAIKSDIKYKDYTYPLEIVKLLLDAGADPNVKQLSGIDPIHMAYAIMYHKNTSDEYMDKIGEIVKLLIKSGAKDLDKTQLLFFFINEKETPNVIQKIINAGAKINNLDDKGYAPIHYAVKNNNIDLLNMLIKSGADINIKDNMGATPLQYASYSNNIEIIKLLIDSGVNLNTPTKKTDSPLILAILNNYLEQTKLLINAGADLNIKDYNGNTPLHIAIIKKRTEIANLLIDSGADINARNKMFYTPLYYAYGYEEYDIAAKLKKMGATNINSHNLKSLKTISYLPKELRKPFSEFTSKIRNVATVPNKKELIVSSQSEMPTQFNDDLQKLIILPVGLTIIPPLPNRLLYLECSGNPLITLPELPNTLRTLICSNCSLESLTLELPNTLEYLDVKNNNIKDIHKLPPKLYIIPYSRIEKNYEGEHRNLLLDGNPLPLGFLNGVGPIGKYSKKRIHRIIEFKDVFIHTTILPKGTLLFRYQESYSEDELLGYRMNNGSRYLYPNMNVFFYPYPFVGNNYGTEMFVFELVRDVEIVMAIAPSINKRSNRYNDIYLTSCNKILNTYVKGKDYDPCFTESFSKQYPELSGLIGIASMDVQKILSQDEHHKFFTKYRSNVIDENNNVSVPEVILHPLSNRYDNTSDPNYKLYASIDNSRITTLYDDAWKYVEEALSANNKWTIDLATRMYVNYESASDEVKNRCVPIEEPYKLHYLNYSYDL